MHFKHFRPSVISQNARNQERYLICLNLAGFEPVASVVAWFLNVWLSRTFADIERDYLDTPLIQLVALIRDDLERRPPLSHESVAEYLAPLFCRLRPVRGRNLGDATLRDYMTTNGTTLQRMVCDTAHRLRRVRFDWKTNEVFELFTAARRKNILNFIQGRFGLPEHVAEDRTQEVFIRLARKLAKYRSRRGSFMAFTFNEARSVVRNYVKRQGKRNLEVSLEDKNAGLPSLENVLAADEPPGKEEIDDTMQIRLAAHLFQLHKPPVQILLFIACRLLGQKPQKLLSKYSNKSLGAFLSDVEPEYLAASGLQDEVVRGWFDKLRSQLAQPLGQVLRGEAHRKTFRLLLTHRAGDIPLGLFFPGEDLPERSKQVVKAWQSVQKRLETDASRWFPDEWARRRRKRNS
jgi:DNA-directed RNA polymerase specialized sigma24 family protein